MVSIQIQAYEAYLDELEAILNKVNEFEEKSATGYEIEKTFGNLLNARDTLQTEIMRVTDIEGDQLVHIAQLDEKLRQVGFRVFRRHFIDMRIWRKVRMPDDQENWWWEIDKELYGLIKDRTSPVRSLIYAALALLILFWNIDFIIQTGGTIASWFLNVFSRVNAQQYGLDVITVVAVVAQVAFSGGLSASINQRITKLTNRFLTRTPDEIRPVTIALVPVSRFFVGTLIFVAIISTIGHLLPLLSRQLGESVSKIEQPLTSAESVLATSALLDPNVDYAVGLTRLGIQNQDVGDGERARALYEQAIGSVPDLIVADYRLANIYVDTDVKDAALQMKGIQLLDHSIQAIDHYKTLLAQDMTPEARQKKQDELLHDLRLTDESYVYRFEVLLLITRARAFMNLNQPTGALVDLAYAEKAVGEHPELFVIPEKPDSETTITDEATPEAPVSVVTNPLRIPELYYLTAKANDNLAISTKRPIYQTRAIKYWLLLGQVVDARIGTERMWALEAQSKTQ